MTKTKIIAGTLAFSVGALLVEACGGDDLFLPQSNPDASVTDGSTGDGGPLTDGTVTDGSQLDAQADGNAGDANGGDAGSADAGDAAAGDAGDASDIDSGDAAAPIAVTSFGSTCVTFGPGHFTSMDVDANGKAYVALLCGTAVSVATSTTGDQFGTPVAITGTTGTIGGASILAGPGGVTHLLITTSGLGTAGTFYARSTDSGATWSAATKIDSTDHTGGFAQIAASGTNVVLGGGTGNLGLTQPWIYSNATSGTGTFTASANPPSSANIVGNGGLGYDSTGKLWYGGEEFELYVQESTDNGATFGAQTKLSTQNSANSAWAFGPVNFAVTGSTTQGGVYTIDPYQTTAAAVTSGLDGAGSTVHATAVDNTGDMYTASTNSPTNTTIYVQQLALNAAAPSTAVTYVSPTGSSYTNPVIAVRAGTTAHVLWTQTTGLTTSVISVRLTY